MLSLMTSIDPDKRLFNVIALAFDSAFNVQKVGEIMAQHFPRVTVIHGAEYVVSIIFEKCQTNTIQAVLPVLQISMSGILYVILYVLLLI
jgi:hypothetical protein